MNRDRERLLYRVRDGNWHTETETETDRETSKETYIDIQTD